MRQQDSRLDTASYLGFLVWTLALVAALPAPWAAGLFALVALFGWAASRAGLRILARRRFWLATLLIVLITAFVLGVPTTRWGIVRFSREGLATGLWMALRAATLMLVFAVTIGALSVAQVVGLFGRLKLRGLGFALGVALNLGPVLQDVAEFAYHTLRLRGGARHPLHSARLFMVTTIANSLSYGDDVVKAAVARAFDPAAPATVTRSLLGRTDRALLVGLLISGVALLVWAGLVR